MPSSDDNRDQPKTLPSPELNPLMNPVLGRNMGRWAEVYFTNPPEKREQAVQELLRVLERESPAGAAAEQPSPAPVDSNQFDDESAVHAAENRPLISARGEELIQCGACGRVALAEQKFCGGCGAPLPVRESGHAVEQSAERSNVESDVPSDAPERDDRSPVAVSEVKQISGNFSSEASEELPRQTAGSEFARELPPQFERPRFAQPEFAQPQSGQDVPKLFQGTPQARFGRSRQTMAVAFAILVLTLFYVAARETAAWLREAHNAQQAAMAASAHPSASAPVPAASTQPEPATPVASERVTPPTEASPARQQTDRTDRARGSKSASSSPEPVQTANAGNENSSPLASRGAGAEELAIAESYLSGTQGKTRNSSQAAQWLWKAVGKQNGAAALLLSDLYVTGDGVPQNCDQARLLLDAAASKQIPGAGERIRDLPNLGCK